MHRSSLYALYIDMQGHGLSWMKLKPRASLHNFLPNLVVTLCLDFYNRHQSIMNSCVDEFLLSWTGFFNGNSTEVVRVSIGGRQFQITLEHLSTGRRPKVNVDLSHTSVTYWVREQPSDASLDPGRSNLRSGSCVANVVEEFSTEQICQLPSTTAGTQFLCKAIFMLKQNSSHRNRHSKQRIYSLNQTSKIFDTF